MAPGQNHRVEINVALEGETVADAIRFVSSGVSAPGIHYVHADHLGSPQKMTDSTKAIVWDAVYTPFGQVHSITGTATNNQRFPGQYADAETGYHQNWFRDYDPRTGRYIQSDPIGLGGGLNTYAYAAENPIRYIDPNGNAVAFPSSSPSTSFEPTPYGPDVADAYGNSTAPLTGFYLPLDDVSEVFGDFSWSNCVRGCLLQYWDKCQQEYVVSGSGGNAGFVISHGECFSRCTFVPFK